ncbi:MAG TPA: hypothetical protein VHA12_03205 [Candidatus Nanoarchaeia archaeon]|nr:hypothetical protein [Candidatus Nanoarchaeia archaeon]
MKKRIKSVLFALIAPLAFAEVKNDVSKLGFTWELSYRLDEGLASSNQFDFGYSDLFLSGSVVSGETAGRYGIKANTKSLGHTFGDFTGRKSTSYFSGTRKTRDDNVYLGVNFQRHPDKAETELFAGAKLGNLFVNGLKSAEDKKEGSAYLELPSGKVIGISSEADEGIKSSGVYYKKGDVGAQVNFIGENFGSKVAFNNILGNLEEFIVDSSERLNAEVGYGNQTRGTFSLGYNFSLPDAKIERFDFNLGYSEASSRGAILENRVRMGRKTPFNLRIRYETKSEKTDFGFDLKY